MRISLAVSAANRLQHGSGSVERPQVAERVACEGIGQASMWVCAMAHPLKASVAVSSAVWMWRIGVRWRSAAKPSLLSKRAACTADGDAAIAATFTESTAKRISAASKARLAQPNQTGRVWPPSCQAAPGRLRMGRCGTMPRVRQVVSLNPPQPTALPDPPAVPA